MSRPLRTKDKDLVNLRVVTADEVWTKNKSGKMVLRKDINIFGRIDKGTSAFITSTNMTGGNHRVVEDSANLSKKTKTAVVDLLKNKNRQVAYLLYDEDSWTYKRKDYHSFREAQLRENGVYDCRCCKIYEQFGGVSGAATCQLQAGG